MSRLSNVMHQQKLACWKQIIIDCRTSGLTDTEYLRRHGISKSNFYYWLRKIREELLEEHPECLHPCKPVRTSAPAQEASTKEAASPESLPAEAPASHPAPVAQDTPLSSVPRPAEFVSVRVPAPLPRDKLMVSCGPFRFELTETTPVPLLQKLAAAWEGAS